METLLSCYFKTSNLLSESPHDWVIKTLREYSILSPPAHIEEMMKSKQRGVTWEGVTTGKQERLHPTMWHIIFNIFFSNISMTSHYKNELDSPQKSYSLCHLFIGFDMQSNYRRCKASVELISICFGRLLQSWKVTPRRCLAWFTTLTEKTRSSRHRTTAPSEYGTYQLLRLSR